METNREISALFTLIDDPDEEVFGVVSDKIADSPASFYRS